jgi:hypothetical protein
VFRPTEAITKEQVVAMIIRILTWTYLDESWAYWYENYMEEAKNRWIIDEYTLWEESPILRHELIALLWRTYSVGQ